MSLTCTLNFRAPINYYVKPLSVSIQSLPSHLYTEFIYYDELVDFHHFSFFNNLIGFNFQCKPKDKLNRPGFADENKNH